MVELDTIFENNFQKEKECRQNAYQKCSTLLQDTNTKGVIIDDLGHLKSMRHLWFKLSVEHDLPVIFIWMNSNVEECIRRNQSRKISVPEESFLKITRTFEKPGKEYFEKNLFEVKNNNFQMEKFIQNTLPVLSRKIELKIQKTDAHVQTERHLCDQIMRKEIGKIIKSYGGDKRKLVEKCNLIKKELLGDSGIDSKNILEKFNLLVTKKRISENCIKIS